MAVGPGEKSWKIGDRVGGGWHGTLAGIIINNHPSQNKMAGFTDGNSTTSGGQDSTCKACKRGLFQMCENKAVNGVSRDGGCV